MCPTATLVHAALLDLLVFSGVLAVLEIRDAQRRQRLAALAQARLEARLVEAHLDALKAQLQPHFLFNTLNAIAVLVRKQDTADAII